MRPDEKTIDWQVLIRRMAADGCSEFDDDEGGVIGECRVDNVMNCYLRGKIVSMVCLKKNELYSI